MLRGLGHELGRYVGKPAGRLLEVAFERQSVPRQAIEEHPVKPARPFHEESLSNLKGFS